MLQRKLEKAQKIWLFSSFPLIWKFSTYSTKYQKHKKEGGRSERTCLTKIKARRKVILLHIIMVCENGEKVLQMLIFQCFLCLKQVKSTVQKRRGYQLDSQGLDIHKLCTCFPTEVFHNWTLYGGKL